MTFGPGDKIEPFSFTDHAGKEWSFPDDFKDTRLALFFLRHLGCPLCKEKVDELKARAADFESRSIKLAAVVQSTEKRSAEYAEKQGIGFSLVPDREKVLYTRFDVRKGGIKEFTAPKVLVSSIRATLKGHMHGKFEGDELQVPASFLLSAEGGIIYSHYGKDISDFGSVDELLAKA